MVRQIFWAAMLTPSVKVGWVGPLRQACEVRLPGSLLLSVAWPTTGPTLPG
jgi:hypothetical protein